MKKEFFKKINDSIKKSNDEVSKSVKFNDLPLEVVQDFKDILGLNSITVLNDSSEIEGICIDLSQDEKQIELDLEEFKDKDIEIYDFISEAVMYDPKEYLNHNAPIVTPLFYNPSHVYPRKYFIIPVSSEFEINENEMIKTIKDMIYNTSNYKLKPHPGLIIRFRYKSNVK